MKLVQEGKFSLSDTVGRFFYDAPQTWNKITVRHLLNHTSGLERESPLFDPFKVQPDSALIKAAFKDPLVFTTGSKWQYCNLGYFMLADIIRRVSGKSFPQYMRDEIFVKNGLMQTRTTTVDDLIQGRADGYVLRGRDTILNATEYIALRPSGAFILTITDMIKWEMLMQENKFLSKDNWQKMWTDVVKIDTANANSASYGYGWETSMYKNRQAAYHGGSLPGFRTIYYRFPADKTAIIILTNSNHTNTPAIAKGIADILYKN
jgi:CubicO group peptidase (beta-lactamase class C family)